MENGTEEDLKVLGKSKKSSKVSIFQYVKWNYFVKHGLLDSSRMFFLISQLQ